MRMIVTALLFGCLLTGCQESPAPELANVTLPLPNLNSQRWQQQGKFLFYRYCLACHGTPVEGKSVRSASFKPAAPDFLHQRYGEVDPRYLYRRIREGKSMEPFFSQGSVMPVFGPHLSVDQTWQLVAYLRHRATARELSSERKGVF